MWAVRDEASGPPKGPFESGRKLGRAAYSTSDLGRTLGSGPRVFISVGVAASFSGCGLPASLTGLTLRMGSGGQATE